MIKPTREQFIEPKYQTEGAVCMDCYLQEPLRLLPMSMGVYTTVVPLGFTIDLPEGYHAKLHLRSSVGRDYPIGLSNGIGIVDTDFEGEVVAFVRNYGKTAVNFDKGDRLFQLEICKTERLEEPKDIVKRGRKSGSTGK